MIGFWNTYVDMGRSFVAKNSDGRHPGANDAGRYLTGTLISDCEFINTIMEDSSQEW